MFDFRAKLGRELLINDGGMGSLLQARGLKGGELPERWNITHPDDIIAVHTAYLEAGADMITTNTFGANALKYPDPDELRAVVRRGVELAAEARDRAGRSPVSSGADEAGCPSSDSSSDLSSGRSSRRPAFVGLDIGPTGKLLAPMGDLPFERAVELFSEVVRIGAEAGADYVIIETMSDAYEAKAAALAAKESCSLPVIVTVTFDGRGKLLTGGSVDSVTATLEGLKVDALGVNCGLGPVQLLPIVKRLTEIASVPVVVNPNAGLPRYENGATVYDVGPEEFAKAMLDIAALPVQVMGGCCGTTPDHIRALADAVRPLPFIPASEKQRTVVSSFSRAVELGRRTVIIGERINPTGKKAFKQALRDRNIDYILNEGLAQESAGADILDVNVGLPEIDEPAMMAEVVDRLQSVTPLPLQIDTSDPAALERALRLYNGKAMVNSVNGTRESIEKVMPVVARYGGVLVGLCLDESGIPDTAEGRVAVALKIYAAAAEYGIPAKDIIIDALALTVSSDGRSALTTLETLGQLKDGSRNGLTILGVSNISFGLPHRELVNAAFLGMAMERGLSAAIMNPLNPEMMNAYRSSLALLAMDENCMDYIAAYAGVPAAASPSVQASPRAAGSSAGAASSGAASSAAASSGAASSGAADAAVFSDKASPEELSSALRESVRRGLSDKAARITAQALASFDPLDLINAALIPALDEVGRGFEQGTVFLPQLLLSADAAKAAFEKIKEGMAGSASEPKGRIILATVKGDIHDIGKNIVKVMLENYSYEVIDLGKDVPPEVIADTAVRENIRLVGLSALMTTTVVSMEDTIKLLRERKPDTLVVVGGAVMTEEYAAAIGADYYAADAMATVRYADKVFGGE